MSDQEENEGMFILWIITENYHGLNSRSSL